MAEIESAEIIGSNQDLISQILFRLPAKPLLRFKSVSKFWLSLISAPQFSSLHTLRNPNSTVSGLILRNSPSHFSFVSLNPTSSSSSSLPLDSLLTGDIKILQSCNGLLLCSTLPNIGLQRKYSIFNPTTVQSFTLPSLEASSVTVYGVNLAFDPYKSPHYKVICVRSTPESIYQYQIEIYESATGAWRVSGSPFSAPFDMVFDGGVFWNGALHWMSPTGKALYFDVDRECIAPMPTHPYSDGRGQRRFRYFGESRAHLHLIEIYGPRSTQFYIFGMKKDYSSWIVRYHVDLDGLLNVFPEMVRSFLDARDSTYYAFVILNLIEEEKEEESTLLLHIPGKIISYNLKAKTFKKVCDLGHHGGRNRNSLQFGWLDVYKYVETLACVS